MFTFDLAPQDLFAERRRQFMAWGIPQRTVLDVEARVDDMWADAPGGWTPEWTAEARRAEASEHWLLAAALFGAARFPCLSTPGRAAALREQVRCFVKASATFGGAFERKVIDCKLSGATIGIPVHVYAPRSDAPLPTVLLSGGVDTGKMELHRVATMLSRFAQVRVVAMDMPGTGESDTPLTKDADIIYRAVLDAFRGSGRMAVFGISFGGHWAAKLALQRDVDVAVDFGGPIGVDPIVGDRVATLPNGMSGIVAHAMRLAASVDGPASEDMMRDFGLGEQGLLSRPDCARLLVVNGSADAYIPNADVEVFRRYPSADVWLLKDLSHCAAEKIMRVVPGIITWLRVELHGTNLANRILHRIALQALPERV